MQVAELAMDNLLTLVQAAETHQYCSETDLAAAIQATSTLLATTARAVTHLVGPVGDLKITNVHHVTGVTHLEASAAETETSQETQEDPVIQTNTTTVPTVSHAIALVQPAMTLELMAVYHAATQQTIIWPHTAADVLKDISWTEMALVNSATRAVSNATDLTQINALSVATTHTGWEDLATVRMATESLLLETVSDATTLAEAASEQAQTSALHAETPDLSTIRTLAHALLPTLWLVTDSADLASNTAHRVQATKTDSVRAASET